MNLRQESLPQANIYSSKILFDQMEDRNRKRMNQILKRKKALSTRNKALKFEEEKFDLSPKNDNEEININTFTQFNKSIYNFYNINENIPKKVETKNSLNDINNNNSTNHNSSILNKESQEKEINCSIIEEEPKDILIVNSNQSIIDKNKSLDICKPNKSIINIDIINCDETFNDDSKENNYYSNEFAIKYLSSSLDSFIKLDNRLVTKAKLQNNCFTDSYSQALELNYDDAFSNNFKNFHNKNYLVTDTIKEEKESETPLKINHKKEKNKHKIYLNENNDEEKEIINRMARKRAYSKRIRNNILNKNIKDEFEINIHTNKKTAEKTLDTSKSCKRIIRNNTNINLTYKKCYCCSNKLKNKNNNEKKKNLDDSNDFNSYYKSRKTMFNVKRKINLNNSFNIFNKIDNNNNYNGRKTLTAMNSSRNLVNKNEKICKKLATSKSNLIIFKKNIPQKNKNDLNISLSNFNTKVIRKDKIRKSKSAKRINDFSTCYKLNDKEKNYHQNNKNLLNSNNTITQINNNKTRILKKNPTMGKLTFIKKTNIHNKGNIPKTSKNSDLNKTVLIKSNKIENSVLNKTISFNNIKKKKTEISNINTRNSMHTRQKAKKIIKTILNTDSNHVTNKLKLNRSYCYLISKKKNS